MYSSLFTVALMLVSQLGGGTDSRYPNGNSGQPAPSSTTPITPPATIAPFGSQPAQPATTPRSTSSTPATSNPYSPSRPSGVGGQPASSAFSNSSSLRGNTQVQPPPGYTPNSFPGNNSASTQASQPPSRSTLMMQAMLTKPSNSQLSGEPVRLVDVVRSGQSRNEQTQRIEAYWDLCSSVADYYLSVREQGELLNLTGTAGQSQAVQDAKNKMAVRSDTSLRAARASQFRLAGFIGRGPNNLPLPGDLPHCGTYTSRYDQVFAGRSSPEAQGLAQLLPMRYTELDEAAGSILSAEDWLKGVISRNESSDAVGNLKALDLLALQRRAFVQIARDYNRRIARYSELATPGPISPDRLTGMLIKRPVSATTPAFRQSGAVDNSLPRTFANSASTDDWLPPEKSAMTGATKIDSAVQPASATQSKLNDVKEHSLVVPPQ